MVCIVQEYVNMMAPRHVLARSAYVLYDGVQELQHALSLLLQRCPEALCLGGCCQILPH